MGFDCIERRERGDTWYPLRAAEELLNGIICEALVPTVIDFEEQALQLRSAFLRSLQSHCLHCALGGPSQAGPLQGTNVILGWVLILGPYFWNKLPIGF